jgi:uncharacterized membrane protein YphA (DoxX/SURF4 family)
MTIVRRLARPMLAAPFVRTGLDLTRHPGPVVEDTRPVLAPLVTKISKATGIPDDPQLVVRAGGAVMAGAGFMLATGRLPRLSALMLTAALVPTAYVADQFWREKDPLTRREKRQRLLTDVGLAGAALLAAVDTQGKPGLAWRSKHASESAKDSAGRAAKQAKRTAKQTAREAKRAAHDAKQNAKLAAKDAKLSAKDLHVPSFG